jgi:aminoglycoside phosphotransferase (APT) family kinase protein
VHYEIHEWVPGRAIELVTAEIADQLVALVDVQRAVGLPGREPWLPEMVGSLTAGRVGYCELASLRAHDPALLERLQAIAHASHDLEVATDDVVHYDFSPYNMLAVDGRVTGVVDWHGATSGDATFDLVTCAYYTLDTDVRDRLLDAARARTDPRALHLYAAHMVLRQVDWCLRFHDDLRVQWFSALGDALLAAVGAG